MTAIDRPPMLADLNDGSSPDEHRRNASLRGASQAQPKPRTAEPILTTAEEPKPKEAK